MERKSPETTNPAITLDATGQLCPIPIIMATKAINEMEPGQTIEILSDDLGIVNDLPLWCKSSGHKLLSLEEKDGLYRGLVMKVG